LVRRLLFSDILGRGILSAGFTGDFIIFEVKARSALFSSDCRYIRRNNYKL